jgi:hypothetical protein
MVIKIDQKYGVVSKVIERIEILRPMNASSTQKPAMISRIN